MKTIGSRKKKRGHRLPLPARETTTQSRPWTQRVRSRRHKTTGRYRRGLAPRPRNAVPAPSSLAPRP